MNFPWLLLILLTPLIATVLLFVPKKYVVFKDNQIALYSSLITLLFVIVVALQFDVNSNAATQFDISFDWIPIFGISFHLGLTGISLVLVGLTAVLTPFLLFGLAGGLVMLAAVIWLYFVGASQLGRGTFSITALSNELSIDTWTERWLFLGFFFAFALKAPMVPGHTWLPDTAEQATPGTSTMLIGILDKVGTYGMLAILLPIFPNASREFAPAIIGLAVFGIIYGALVAIAQ